jgi:hypothetical protein
MSSECDNSELNGSFCLLLLRDRYAMKTLPYRLSLPPTRFETFEFAFNGKVDCDCKCRIVRKYYNSDIHITKS